MKKENYNYDDVVEMLEVDGIMQEPDMNWILEYIDTEYSATIDTCLLYTSPSPRDRG